MNLFGSEGLGRHARLGLVVDLDGTLIPHAATPAEAALDDPTRALLVELAAARDTWVAVVSGRLRDELDAIAGEIPNLFLIAEHGAWRRAPGAAWESAPIRGADPQEIAVELRRIASAHAGALVERKVWSVCLHYRQVAATAREALVIEAADAMERWCAERPEYEVLDGVSVMEVRHHDANKGTAVDWLRARIPADTYLIALGDDVTDEDAFARLEPRELSVRVGRADRPTRATARLDDVAAVRAFLREIARVRRDATDLDPLVSPSFVAASANRGASLVVISNRLPDVVDEDAGESERARNVGGLVSGLLPAFTSRGGVWLGWSGAQSADPRALAIDARSLPTRAAFDFEPRWQTLFYNGFANRALWPIFHSFPGRTRYSESEWESYREVNDLFAEHAAGVAAPDGRIWAHDYHLLLVAEGLRRRGHRGALGHFLHIPFPALDLFETIPWAVDLMRGMLAYDLLGFHTHRYAENFVRCARALVDARPTETGLAYSGRAVRVGVFPLGIDAEPFAPPPGDEVDSEIEELQAALRGRKLVLGVDRLDYTKGIPERLEAFARFLELFPAWRGKVTFVQVAVPSRADVPEYAEQRRAVETLVGRINGEHGEAHWVPVRYVYRSYPRAQLARLYRAADVGFVTPLRDGMNLVAKEYVAAQSPDAPGVLLLSRFAGAADELDAAVLTNPHDRSGMARDLERALSMGLDERLARHRALTTRVSAHSPEAWASGFLAALDAAPRS